MLKAEYIIENSYENREEKKIDQLFTEFYKFKTGVEISDELMAAFLEVVNGEDMEYTAAENDRKNCGEMAGDNL